MRHIICGKGNKHPLIVNSITIEHTTLATTSCADGSSLPAFLIYLGSFPSYGFIDGIPDNWVYNWNESGYMTGELMVEYLKKCYLPNIGQDRPHLLLLDNHKSHLTPGINKPSQFQ